MEKKTKYQNQLKGNQRGNEGGGGGRGGGGSSQGAKQRFDNNKMPSRRLNSIDRLKQREEGDIIDSKFGFQRYVEVISHSILYILPIFHDILGNSKGWLASKLSSNGIGTHLSHSLSLSPSPSLYSSDKYR